VKNKELTICGLAAIKARWASEPLSILRLFFDPATGRRLGAICKVLAAERKVYRSVSSAELEKISGSKHHGGVVAIVAAPVLLSPRPADVKRWAAQRAPLLILDRVGNAHNLGALARTATFLGVEDIIITDSPESARPNDAAYRVAEGGLEKIKVWAARDLALLIKDLRQAGYAVFAAATRGGRPECAVEPNQPSALVMGNEQHGIDSKVAVACSRSVTIPGTRAVESLNVSVAGAILMWELFGRDSSGSFTGR
jgi:TrmH RNA methyltransferase